MWKAQVRCESSCCLILFMRPYLYQSVLRNCYMSLMMKPGRYSRQHIKKNSFHWVGNTLTISCCWRNFVTLSRSQTHMSKSSIWQAKSRHYFLNWYQEAFSIADNTIPTSILMLWRRSIFTVWSLRSILLKFIICKTRNKPALTKSVQYSPDILKSVPHIVCGKTTLSVSNLAKTTSLMSRICSARLVINRAFFQIKRVSSNMQTGTSLSAHIRQRK